MKHYGDVSKINGAEVEPVDIITFGAPCQDLSVAGKRMGLKHSAMGDEETTRSGLFYEAIRIIKEMREATNNEYPKYAVYENVPGAFSSNKGHDFHAVLEAFCSVCDGAVSIPKPYGAKQTDKLFWNKAGEIVGDNYSIAWRTLDAQYWGVAQRRKRIYLVADFTGRRAGEILFKPDSLRGNLPQGNETWQGSTSDAVGSVDESNGNGGQLAATLTATYGTKWNGNAGSFNGENFVLQNKGVDRSVGVECLNPWDCQSKRIYNPDGIYCTLPAMDCGGANNQAVIVLNDQGGSSINVEGETLSPTLRANSHQHEPVIAFAQNQREEVRDLGDKAGALAAEAGVHQQTYVAQPVIALQAKQQSLVTTEECSNTLGANDWKEPQVIALQANGIDRAAGFCQGASPAAKTIGYQEEVSPTIKGAPSGTAQVPAVCYPLNEQIILRHGALGKNTGFGAGEDGDPAYTLQANHPHAVCYQESVGALQARDYKGVGNQYVGEDKLVVECYDARGNGDGKIACTITGDHQNRVTDYTAVAVQELPSTASGKQHFGTLQASCAEKQWLGNQESLTGDYHIVQKANPPRKYIIRRLTPTECARLQGFPDDWGKLAPYNPADAEFWESVRKTHAEINGKNYKPVKNIKKWYEKLHTDSAEYKMWGNGLALPNAEYVLQGIAEQGAKTLGSLFDGSGGFPLAGVLNGIKPIWASEVEPYPIAVTKSRFKEEPQK